jgi:hypothetical protein
MNYSRATARRDRIEGDITVPAFALTARETYRVSQHQYPEDFVFRRRPGLAARVDTIRAPIMWAELGIILQALNGTASQRAGLCPVGHQDTAPRRPARLQNVTADRGRPLLIRRSGASPGRST